MLSEVIAGGEHQRPGAIHTQLPKKRRVSERLGDAASGRK
jgi:hypothetical protein